MINRALKLKDRLEVYLYQNKDRTIHGSRQKRVSNSLDLLLLQHDILTESDWSVLKNTDQILEVFQKLTLRTQRKGKFGERGVVWEYLPAFNLLMESLKEKKDIMMSYQQYRKTLLLNHAIFLHVWEMPGLK